MKKINSLIALIFLAHTISAQDKSFQKGSFVITVGAGFGAYATKYKEEKDTTLYSFSWQGIQASKSRISKEKNDGAVSAIYPLMLEYGLTNWLGLGARVAYAKFYANADSSNNYVKPTVTSFDAGLNVNLHFIKSKRFELPLSMNIGYSKFQYLNNFNTYGKAVSNGFNYGFALLPRIYFGKHIGMYFNLGYAAYIYPNIKFSDNTNSNLNQSNNVKAKINGNGANLGIGLIVKI
jgi:hypothetical protein